MSESTQAPQSSQGPAPFASATQDLRQRAEDAARRAAGPLPAGPPDPSPDALRQTLHELQVHQIEPEMQNEELRRTQAALEAERARFFDLYDMAPVGYCSVSKQGRIEQADNTATRHFGGTGLGLVITRRLAQLMGGDEPINREIVQEILQDVGLAVDCAEDGMQAVERAGQAGYDLVLMDMQMPRMDGLEAGMNDFMTKPIAPNILFPMLLRWLKQPRG